LGQPPFSKEPSCRPASGEEVLEECLLYIIIIIIIIITDIFRVA